MKLYVEPKSNSMQANGTIVPTIPGAADTRVYLAILFVAVGRLCALFNSIYSL